MGQNSFSICFGSADGSHGKLAIGEGIQGGGKYVTLEAKGHTYWAVYMTALKMGATDLGGKACAPQCAAVIDSGTSLIGVPTGMYNSIQKHVGFVKPDCSNRDSLPDITITMGGHDFVITSKHYVVKSVADDTAANATSAAGSAAAAGSEGGRIGTQSAEAASEDGSLGGRPPGGRASA